MNVERYVVLGLARPRSAWFSDISRWATAAAIPVEFVKCLGPDEARARLASGRRWSAFLVDADAPVTHVTPAAVRRQTTVEPAAGAPEPEEETVDG